jgi:hypothetical protein
MLMDMTATETLNPHRISVVNPGAYRHIGEFYQGINIDMMEAFAPEHRYLAALGIEFGDFGPKANGNVEFHRNGGCAHCGSHFAYGSVFSYRRGRVNEYVAVGHICAANTFSFNDEISMRAARAKKCGERARAETKRQAKAAEAWGAFLAGRPALAAAATTEHYIVADIISKGAYWGSVSEKQEALVIKIAADEAEKAANPAEEKPVGTVPTLDKRASFEGVIISEKWQSNQFGDTLKMLVEIDGEDGAYRLWGTKPDSLDGTRTEGGEWVDGPGKGDRVRFDARVKASDDDAAFGFFSRPTKAVAVSA